MPLLAIASSPMHTGKTRFLPTRLGLAGSAFALILIANGCAFVASSGERPMQVRVNPAARPAPSMVSEAPVAESGRSQIVAKSESPSTEPTAERTASGAAKDLEPGIRIIRRDDEISTPISESRERASDEEETLYYDDSPREALSLDNSAARRPPPSGRRIVDRTSDLTTKLEDTDTVESESGIRQVVHLETGEESSNMTANVRSSRRNDSGSVAPVEMTVREVRD